MKYISSFTDRGYSTLTPYISRYFDTATRSKTDSHSYQEIAKILQPLPVIANLARNADRFR